MKQSLTKYWNRLAKKVIGFSKNDPDYKEYMRIKNKYGYAPAKLKIFANGACGYDKEAFIREPKVARVIYRDDVLAIQDLDTWEYLRAKLSKQKGIWQSLVAPL